MMLLALYWQKGALIGIPIGAYLVYVLPEQILFWLLGATMVYVAIDHFRQRRQPDREISLKWETAIGGFSRVLAAGFNMGGPPIVAYAYSRPWSIDQAKAVIASVFVTTGIGRLFFLGFTGNDLPKVLWLAAVLMIPSAIILRLGIALGRRIPHTALRPAVFAYLGLVGAYYLRLH